MRGQRFACGAPSSGPADTYTRTEHAACHDGGARSGVCGPASGVVGGGAEVRDRGGDTFRSTVDGGACHEDVGAGAGRESDGLDADAAVHLEITGGAVLRDHAAEAFDL